MLRADVDKRNYECDLFVISIMLQVNLPQVVAFLSSYVSISVAGVNIFNYPKTVLGLWDAWHIGRVCTSHPALPGSNLTVSNPGTSFFFFCDRSFFETDSSWRLNF